MVSLGRTHTLRVNRIATPGVYLDGGNLGEILLPGRYVPKGTIAGEEFTVFIHRDSEDRVVATTETPFAQVGEFASLRAVSVNPAMGAFLDWGLSKDLLLPRREQAYPVKQGDWVVVHVFVDPKTDRIVASARLDRFLDLEPFYYPKGQRVDLLVIGETELGYSAIINNRSRGLLYRTEMAAPLVVGQRVDGYIKTVRTDGKIDLSLDPMGYKRIAPLGERILEALKEAGGTLPYHDGSAPEEIRAAFDASKKAFKQAIGALFKERKIVIGASGISLVDTESAKPDR